MATKEVATRQKGTATVTSAVRQSLARMEEEFLRQHGIPREVTRTFVTKLLGSLENTTAALTTAEVANESELADDGPVRAERDRRRAEVAKWMPKIRSDVQTHHGEEGAKELGLDGETPEDPQLLSNHAAVVLDRLAKWKVRPSEIDDEEFDPKKWAKRLAPSAKALADAVAAMAKEIGEGKAAYTAKLAAIEAHDAAFSGVANVSTALLLAIGEKELARRTRPSARSPGRTTEQDENGGGTPTEPLQPTG